MIIATWNVNSISVRLPHVLQWLEKYKPNVLCIQETKATDDKFPAQSFGGIGYHCEFFGEKAYNGVAILSDSKPSRVLKGFAGEPASASKRFIEVAIGPLSVLNVYIPNGSEVGSDKFHYKLKWVETLGDHLNQAHKPAEKLVLCGDFNVAPEDRDVYDPVALAGQILLSDEERAAVEAVRRWGFIDTFRMHNQEPGYYSWWDYRAMAFRRKMGLRIDHIWATQPLAERCTRAWIDVEPRKLEKPSDHAPVAAEFRLD